MQATIRVSTSELMALNGLIGRLEAQWQGRDDLQHMIDALKRVVAQLADPQNWGAR